MFLGNCTADGNDNCYENGQKVLERYGFVEEYDVTYVNTIILLLTTLFYLVLGYIGISIRRWKVWCSFIVQGKIKTLINLSTLLYILNNIQCVTTTILIIFPNILYQFPKRKVEILSLLNRLKVRCMGRNMSWQLNLQHWHLAKVSGTNL